VSTKTTRSSATAEVASDADDVDFRVHSALTLAFNSFTMHVPSKQTVLANRETVIQGHSRSSVVVPIDTAYMTSY